MPLESAEHQRQGVLDPAAPGKCKKQPETFNAPSAESFFYKSFMSIACLLSLGQATALDVRVLSECHTRLTLREHLLEAPKIQIFATISLPPNLSMQYVAHYFHSQQKHPSHHAWRSVQSQGLEPIQTSCRRLQDTSLKRDVLRSL